MKRIVNELGKLSWGKRVYAVVVLCAAIAVALPAQTFTTLHSFDGTDGTSPVAGLVQATNGDLYGTTADGGANGGGTVFKISLGSTLTSLYSFCAHSGCTDGSSPQAVLVQDTNGDFYGTTLSGGTRLDALGSAAGTVFKITPSGVLTTLHDFCAQAGCQDGESPWAGLVQATNRDLYGTTGGGGASGPGTVFKIVPGGTLMTLHSFDSEDGASPLAALVQAPNGDLYGTTYLGGAHGGGTVFEITPSGALSTLYNFCAQTGCTDGKYPSAGLVQAASGDFYGTTQEGGANGAGTVFKITPSGTLMTLHSFCALGLPCTDGQTPSAGLIQATNGDFYGTTFGGGTNGSYGTIFKITPRGALTTLYSFCSQSRCADGANPQMGLVQATDGDFYGTTFAGGAGSGTVFSLSVGLSPFVKTLPTSGEVGAAVRILGSDLTGATSVSFNDTEVRSRSFRLPKSRPPYRPGLPPERSAW
jgi:uncharacterized repeat protein (TIGR03803 family)